MIHQLRTRELCFYNEIQCYPQQQTMHWSLAKITTSFGLEVNFLIDQLDRERTAGF